MPETPSLADQVRAASTRFAQLFGRPARFAAAAPGRVNLIGEHTDYNEGFVLPMAIERFTVIVADFTPPEPPSAAQRASPRVRIHSVGHGAPAEFTIDGNLRPGEPRWANYVKGVAAGCLAEGIVPGAGAIPKEITGKMPVPQGVGFDALIDSTVPLGGGLSSSAALEVAMATLLEALSGRRLELVRKALLCQRAEHEFAGVPCGIMDQFISTLAEEGSAMLLDCRTHATRMVPLGDPAPGGVSVLIANTNVKHELTGGEYAQRRAQCEAAAKALGVRALRDATMAQLLAPPEARPGARAEMDPLACKRARHIISENARTLGAAEAMAAGNWASMGELMYESHASLRDDFEVSCAELDLMVVLASELASKGGVYGSRMTGGGFGGCTVSLVRTECVERITRHLHDRYRAETGVEPTIFATRPAGGARIILL